MPLNHKIFYKKFDSLSRKEIHDLFLLRSEVLLLSKTVFIKILMEETQKQIIFYYTKTIFFVGTLEFFLKTRISKKLLLEGRLLKKNTEEKAMDTYWLKNL